MPSTDSDHSPATRDITNFQPRPQQLSHCPPADRSNPTSHTCTPWVSTTDRKIRAAEHGEGSDRPHPVTQPRHNPSGPAVWIANTAYASSSKDRRASNPCTLPELNGFRLPTDITPQRSVSHEGHCEDSVGTSVHLRSCFHRVMSPSADQGGRTLLARRSTEHDTPAYAG